MLKKLFQNLQQKSRKKKFELFMESMNPGKDTKILDLGSGSGTFLEEMIPHQYRKNITALEISDRRIKKFKENHPDIKIIKGDGRKLPFPDKHFDIIFSNAVIEHVGDMESQQNFAEEIRRVGKRYFVTTPNKNFPFEPHYRLVGFQFMPKILQRLITKYVALGNYPKGYWEDINLLSKRQLKYLFPEVEIHKQRVCFLLWAETLIAIKK